MLSAHVVVGGFFGDEGKGKYVGWVGRDYDAVLRVNASTNAGHCVSDGTHSWVTRQLPSVFFPERTQLVIGPGALLNPLALADELRERPDVDALRGKLLVASSVSLVIDPYIRKGQGGMSALLGSTQQGTGPSAVARAARHSLHLYDVAAVVDGDAADRERVVDATMRTCVETSPLEFAPGADATRSYAERVVGELAAAYTAIRDLVGEFCVDFTAWTTALHAGPDRRVLVEGCNGLLLDNLHGAHPHVTSTSTNIGALMCGGNLAPRSIERVTVVVAAYATCLGKRPFPTEMSPDDARHFYDHCNEVDPAQMHTRRVGWLDLPGLRKALAGSQGAELHLNKLDVLSGLARIKLCTHYRIDGDRVDVMPDDPRRVARAVAEYVELPGWGEPLTEVRRAADLPPAARGYVDAVAAALPNDVVSVGVGPRNDDVIAL